MALASLPAEPADGPRHLTAVPPLHLLQPFTQPPHQDVVTPAHLAYCYLLPPDTRRDGSFCSHTNKENSDGTLEQLMEHE